MKRPCDLAVAIRIDKNTAYRRVWLPIPGGVEHQGVAHSVAISVGDEGVGETVPSRVHEHKVHR